MARPKKEIDYNLCEKLASVQCTQEEIASVLEISVRTLQRDDEFCRIYKKGRENGKISLRRMQWRHAEKSASMSIWLGKQYLGQRDVPEIEGDTNELLTALLDAYRSRNVKSVTEAE